MRDSSVSSTDSIVLDQLSKCAGESGAEAQCSELAKAALTNGIQRKACRAAGSAEQTELTP